MAKQYRIATHIPNEASSNIFKRHFNAVLKNITAEIFMETGILYEISIEVEKHEKWEMNNDGLYMENLLIMNKKFIKGIKGKELNG